MLDMVPGSIIYKPGFQALLEVISNTKHFKIIFFV